MNTDQEKFTKIVLQALSENVQGMEDSASVILGILLVLLFLGTLALSVCLLWSRGRKGTGISLP